MQQLINRHINIFICIIFLSMTFCYFMLYKNDFMVFILGNVKLKEKPNFIFFLTDDQDSLLGTMKVMKNVKIFIEKQGVVFENAFVSNPLCCPSRASILTGLYVHNHRVNNNSVSGGCNSHIWQAGPEKSTFVNHLHRSGYRTFFAGKYMNQYGSKSTGGLKHIPPGWDWWVGLKGNSKYYNYELSVNGTSETHGNNSNIDYLTTVMRKKSLEFLRLVSPANPFFMMVSTPACHAPFDAEPKYNSRFKDDFAPRTENFNVKNDETKHWLLRNGEQPLNSDILKDIDEIYRKRLRTLLSVDELLGEMIKLLKMRNLLSNTYLIFTSDNGYHLGQFSLPLDKREPYEFDIKVPFIISGPGLRNKIVTEPVMNVDLAPTILDLASVAIPPTYDGISLRPYLFNNRRINRTAVLIEHSGEEKETNPGCEHLGSHLYGCDPRYACKCSDSKNNTYTCLRQIKANDSILYCEWEDSEKYVELYDIKNDPYQLDNKFFDSSPDAILGYSGTLSKIKNCSGSLCNIH